MKSGIFSFMKKVQVTQDGFEKMQKEYDELTKTKRPSAVTRLQTARAMGDLSENSEYTAAKEDLAFIEGRIKELEELLHNAKVVTNTPSNGIIDIGSHVRLEKDGVNIKYTIVGEFEANPTENRLSHTSPIGRALMGKRVGERVDVEVPAGKSTYKILEIQVN